MNRAVVASAGWFRNIPIRRKLTILMALSSAVGLLIAGIVLIGYTGGTARTAALRDLEATARIAADNVTAALIFGDVQTADQLLSALRAKTEIDAACLYAASGEDPPQLFAVFRAHGDVECPAQPGPPGVRQRVDRFESVRAVEQDRERIGWLWLRQDLRPLRHSLSVQIAITLAVLALSLLISLAIAWAMQPALAEPILGLAGVARRVSESGDYSQRAHKFGNDEVGRLVDDFNLMLDQIALRDREIERARDALAQQVHEKTQANEELTATLERLREAQAQLVQAERLASLGGLVAGVAHEINTPVGVGVTAASTLEDWTRDIERQYRSNELKRSDLERFIEVARESSLIILRNLQRAADLIHSFKQVAVDQSSGERRRFRLKSYIDEVLLSLAPKTKKSGHGIEIRCADDIELDSYPGAIAQILTNFISNSLLHAFPDGRRGTLRIAVAAAEGWVTLEYADDGVGIPAEHLKRVFDPFFTTKRGTGGSGLGLHIVFNLVHQLLGGTIEVSSAPDQGTRFVVRFPVNAPGASP
ncbi:ATP-binding protein [Fontimonas sp. SYSU GA230001]|uniref:ATP-binding protein n=1 Tax=Fontimonas sp. SYSU GA230001 TaxID=3142450 RepID=UPI0032B4D606